MRMFAGLLLSVGLLVTACSQADEGKDIIIETSSLEEAMAYVDAISIKMADNTEWLTHGRTYSEHRFSPLDKVNTTNICDLSLAWSYDLDSSRGIEVTPIVHNGIMYVTSTWNVVSALDARTGEGLWKWVPEIDKVPASNACFWRTMASYGFGSMRNSTVPFSTT